ncbi:MAG: hypothetical protein IPJ65_37535 [Archangiaceae bacterium]|nr:hypothetical protein [Archangiaceae bacterium]
MLLALAGCKTAAQLDLKLELACSAAGGGALPIDACCQLGLGCASFVEVRAYEVAPGGGLGDVLQTACLEYAELGAPADFCAFSQPHMLQQVLSHVPAGKTVVFRVRVLFDTYLEDRCSDDATLATPPVTLVDAFSEAVPLDGTQRTVTVRATGCGSCSQVSPQCVSRGAGCTAPQCDAGTHLTRDALSHTCCNQYCAADDAGVPVVDAGCAPPVRDCTDVSCSPLGMCPGGVMPVKLAGECCYRCPG